MHTNISSIDWRLHWLLNKQGDPDIMLHPSKVFRLDSRKYSIVKQPIMREE